MTLDVYADLFDSDLRSVAESVGKMWAGQAQPHKVRRENGLYQHLRALRVRALKSEPPVRIELTTARLQGD
jgi:hypothetical protein